MAEFNEAEQKEIKKLARQVLSESGTNLENVPEEESFNEGDYVPFIKNDNTVAKIQGTSIGSGGGGGDVTVDEELSGRSTNPVQNKAIKSAIDKKQDTLVGSGTGQNVKTINGESIVGSGNIVIQGGGGTGTVSGVKVGSSGSVISPTDGVVTIPSYEDGAQKHIAPTASEVKTALETVTPSQGKFLRDDGTWQTPPSGGGDVTGVKGDSESQYRTGNVNITKANIGLGNVGNFKAVSTAASQGLTDAEKSNARTNIGAGTSNFSGSYNDLSDKPTIPAGVTVDTKLSKTSVNPVQNKVITEAIENAGNSNEDAHLKSLTEITSETLQAFFDQALQEKRNVDLDGMTITIHNEISLKNPIYGQNWYWWIIKNGIIIIDADSTENLFTTPKNGTYPLYGCITFENVTFINSTVAPNLSLSNRWGSVSVYGDWTNNYDYEHPNTETRNIVSGWNKVTERDYTPLTKKVCLLSGNRFCRIRTDNCTFDGVSLVESGSYIQSLYVISCQIYNLEYNFILAPKAYDIHFINNTVDRSMEATLIDIQEPESLQITNNLIQYVRGAVSYAMGRGVAITGNYFEGCRSHIVEQYNYYWSTNYGLQFTGNSCYQSEYDISIGEKPDRTYYYLYFYGVAQAYLIAGNSFYPQKFTFDDDSYPDVVKPLHFVRASEGIFLPSRKAEQENTNYKGSYTIPTVVKSITGKESILDGGYCATYIPVSRDSKDMGHHGSIPQPGSASRVVVNQLRNWYAANNGDPDSEYTDRLWKVTMMDNTAPYIPWTYVKRQLAEDVRRRTIGEITDENIVQSPWIRQALMLDGQFGTDYLDLNLGKPGSRVDFTTPVGYYDGLFRFDPSYGLEWWHTNKWVDGFGVPVEWKKYGKRSERPLSPTVITDFTGTGGYVNNNGIWDTSNPTNNNAALIDVSNYVGKHIKFDTTGNIKITFITADPVDGQAVEFSTGYTGTVWCNSTSDFIVRSGTKYLVVILKEGGTSYTTNSVSLPNLTAPYGMLAGQMFFDIDINKPTWYTGNINVGDVGWVDANGDNPYSTQSNP